MRRPAFALAAMLLACPAQAQSQRVATAGPAATASTTTPAKASAANATPGNASAPAASAGSSATRATATGATRAAKPRKPPSEKQLAAYDRMRKCNAQAREQDLHGDPRRGFMKGCLSTHT